MRLTGRYVWDREAGTLVKISDKVPNPHNTYAIQEMPFDRQVMDGYKKAAQRPGMRNAFRPETIKRAWGAT